MQQRLPSRYLCCKNHWLTFTSSLIVVLAFAGMSNVPGLWPTPISCGFYSVVGLWWCLYVFSFGPLPNQCICTQMRQSIRNPFIDSIPCNLYIIPVQRPFTVGGEMRKAELLRPRVCLSCSIAPSGRIGSNRILYNCRGGLYAIDKIVRVRANWFCGRKACIFICMFSLRPASLHATRAPQLESLPARMPFCPFSTICRFSYLYFVVVSAVFYLCCYVAFHLHRTLLT